ncbi:hypothetical protein FA95DRAFT_1563970, partial [Auriscalpium vulgare]
LSVLCLDGVTLPPEFLDAIELLVTLQEVDITDCVFDLSIDKKEAEMPTTPWTRFVFCDNHNHQPYLHRFAALAASAHLSCMKTSDMEVAHAILSRPVNCSLEELQLPISISDPHDWSFLRDVFTTAAKLRILSFSTADRLPSMEDMEHHGLPRESLPRLETLRCPVEYLASLIAGRPVSDVEIISPARVTRLLDELGRLRHTDIYSILKKSSAPIRVLCVEIEAVFQGYIPRLTCLDTLTLYAVVPHLDFENLSDIPLNSTVRAVHFRLVHGPGRRNKTLSMTGYDLARESTLLGTLEKAFPQA